MRFFNGVKNIEELKKEYRRLLFIHHPDKGGNKEDVQVLNEEYQQMFKILNNTSNREADHKAMPDDFQEIINKIINLDVEIEICGSWVWVSGNTKPLRKELNEAGFFWASKKQMWYWHSEDDKSTSHKAVSMDDIRNKYGSEKVNTNKRFAIA